MRYTVFFVAAISVVLASALEPEEDVELYEEEPMQEEEELYRAQRSLRPDAPKHTKIAKFPPNRLRDDWGRFYPKNQIWGPQNTNGQNGNIRTLLANGNSKKPSSELAVVAPSRFRRSPEPFRSWQQGGPSFPGSVPNGNRGGDRGSWGVSVNKDRGTGPQIRAEGSGNIYTSPKGNVRVDGNGYFEAGKGRKPSHGVGINVQGRFKRSPEPKDEKNSVTVTREQTRGQKPRYEVQANRNVWESRNKNHRVDVQGNYRQGGGQRRDYGGRITYTGRFRREVDDEVGEVEEADVEEVEDLQ